MKILVLCHGNKYRSPACEGFLKAWGHTDVVSAGFVNPGRPAAKKMRDALITWNVDLDKHRSQVVTQKMIDNAELILYMDSGNYNRLLLIDPRATRKARCLAAYIGEKRIPDPAFITPKGPSFVEIVNKIREATKAVYHTHINKRRKT